MMKLIVKPLIYVLAVFVLVGCVSKKKFIALQKENANLKQKVELLGQQNQEFNDKLMELSEENKKLKKQN